MPNPFIRRLRTRFALTNSDINALLLISGSTFHVENHFDLICQGDKPEFVHLILSGFACRYKILPDGGRSIFSILVPGDFCDLDATTLSEMDHYISTLCPCKIVSIHTKTIQKLTKQHPRIHHALMWTELVDRAVLREWLVNMGRRSAIKHIAHILCEFYVRLEFVGLVSMNSYALPITQSDLADATGLTAVHVNRMLTELRGAGLIKINGRDIHVPNVIKLKKFAGFNPSYLHLEMIQR